MTSQELERQLSAGKVAMLPTDTVYGLVCLPTHPAAVAKIYELKARPREMNLPIFVRSMEMAEQLGLQINAAARQFLLSEYMPGALTLIVAVDGSKAPAWLSGREEVAIRIPDNELLLDVLDRVGPLLATSANKHGSKVDTCSFPDSLADLAGEPDITLDGGQLTMINSTIVNCRHNPPSIQREGAIPQGMLNLLTHEG